MTTNLIIQYSLVGLCLTAITVWMIVRILKIRKHGYKSSCCGCSLKGACTGGNVLKTVNNPHTAPGEHTKSGTCCGG